MFVELAGLTVSAGLSGLTELIKLTKLLNLEQRPYRDASAKNDASLMAKSGTSDRTFLLLAKDILSLTIII